MIVWGWEEWGSWGVMGKGNRVSLRGDENMLKLMAVMVANFVNILKATDLYALNCTTYEIYINKAV